MKYRAFFCLVALLIIGILAAGCGTNPPVNNTKHLQDLVQAGQTLEQVQELMTDTLKDRMTVYPAKNIEKQATGNWTFEAKEGGSPGDTDAQYLAIVMKPDPANNKYFTVFLKDGKVTTTEWFGSTGAAIIQRILSNTLETQ